MPAKAEKIYIILRIDSQYCSTLPQKLEIFKAYSRESPHLSWLPATYGSTTLGANIRDHTNKDITNILLLAHLFFVFRKK